MRILVPTGPKVAAILAAHQAPNIVHMSAYANTLTALIPTIYAAMDVVSRELVGFIPSAMRGTGVERATLGQSVAYPVAPAQTAYDIAPAMTIPEPPDNNIGTDTMTLTKARAVPFGFTGEEQVGLNSGGPGYLDAQGQLVAQALRTLTNEIEVDLALAAARGASRAYGTAGTTPFGSGDLTDIAQIKKILDDNGAPTSGRSLVLNTTASAKFITLSNVTKANEAGSSMTLRQGELLDIYGLSIKDSAGPRLQTKGTGVAPTTNATGYAIGATVITLAAASTGTIVVGDVVTFAGDTNKYLVVSGDADVSGGGTITLAAPGLRAAIPAAATLITLGASYLPNVGFSMNALAVAMRPPAMPVEGDARLDSMLITDPRSGVTYEVSIWPGYRKVRAEIGLVWGTKATKSEHIALLLG